MAASGALPASSLGFAPKKATIVEGVGMGGVRLGMTEKQVRAKWGAPAVGQSCTAVATGVRACGWDVGRKGSGDWVQVELFHGKVAFLGERTPGWKTKKGAAFATHLDRLQALYPGRLRLVTTMILDRCYVADLTGGTTATLFTFTRPSAANMAGVDAVRIYDPRKVSWDTASAPKGRPVDQPGSCDARAPGGSTVTNQGPVAPAPDTSPAPAPADPAAGGGDQP